MSEIDLKLETPMPFDAENIGESLKEVAVEIVETDSEDLLSRWYRSEQDVDLFVWVDSKKNIIKQQMSVCGQLVEWNILEGVKTGMVVEEEETEESKVKETVHFDRSPMMAAIDQVLEVLRHAAQLPEKDRMRIVENFKLNLTLNNMELDEFQRRFGTSKSETFWDKLKGWIKAS